MTIPTNPERPDRIEGQEAITSGRPSVQPPTVKGGGQAFQSYMQGTPGTGAPAAGPAGPSPAGIPQGPALQTAGPSMESLVAQVSTQQDSMANLRNQLNTKDLQLKRSQQYLLGNKLESANDYLRAANAKMGANTAPDVPKAPPGPMERFLNFVNDGEGMLKSAQQQLADMKNKGDQMSPADYLFIQIKMNAADQEINYATTVLSKAITSLTTILNTQL